MFFVLIDEPQGTYYGGTVAGPVILELMENVLPYLGFLPEYTTEEQEERLTAVPDVTGMTAQEAKNALYQAGLSVDWNGDGGVVVSQLPPAGQRVNKDTKVILTLQEESFFENTGEN